MTLSEERAARQRAERRAEDAEAELARVRGVLEHRRRRLASILGSIADGVVVSDQNARLVLFNPAAERLLGRGLTDAAPSEWSSTYGVFLPDGVTPFPEAEYPLVRALQGRESEQVDQFIRNASVPEGRYISVSGRPLRGDDGRIEGAVVAFRDVTQARLTAERVARLNDDLEARLGELASLNDELEAFTYSVSHDLRAPLRHIDGFVSLLRGRLGDGLDPTSARQLDVIAGAARRMSRLIEDLLALSRLGRTPLRMADVELAPIVAAAVEATAPEPGSRRLDVRVGPLPRVRGDSALLEVVFVNLLSNAVKYTARREHASVEVSALRADGDEVVVVVRDDGAGFDPRYAGKLFGIFQRLHRDDEFEGTGVGLATVRRVVQRHGGRVWAEGRVGEGASFYVALPGAEAA